MSGNSKSVSPRFDSERVSEASAPEDAEPGAKRDATGDGVVTVEQLYSKLRSNGVESDGKDVRLTPEQRSEVILDDVLQSLFDGSEFDFEESNIKEDLDEILLLLVALRSSDTHGKKLMGDLATIFGTRLSPGTVYPQLHELEDDGLLYVQELVRTKEYRVDDEAELIERITATMEQHLALGLFFKAALEELV